MNPGTESSLFGPSPRRTFYATALLVLLLSAVYFDVLFLGNNFFTRDLTFYHYPMKKVVRDVILDGYFPSWNPWFAGGQPMAANPAYEVFYPPQWITMIPDYNLGFRLHILFHVYLGGVGALLFLISRGVRRWVALAGGAAFALGGPLASTFNLLPFLFSVAWTPWIARFAASALETRSRRSMAALVFCLGMQALICEPTTLMQTWFLVGLWALWSGVTGAENHPARAAITRVATAVVAILAGVVLAAVQFLPAIDHAADSVRRDGFSFEIVSQWSFPAVRLFELVYPNFLGVAEAGGPLFWGSSLYPGSNAPYLMSVYIGLPFIALAAAGVLVRKRGWGFVVVSSFLCFLVALGSGTPLLRLLYDVGLFSTVRYPEKFMLPCLMVILAWSCMVFEDVLRGERRVAHLTLTVLGATVLVAVGVVIIGVRDDWPAWFRLVWVDSSEQAASIARVHWIIAVARGLACMVVIEVARRRQAGRAAALLVLVVVADLGMLGNQINPRVPRRFFDPPPTAEIVSRMAGGGRLLHIGWLDRFSAGYRSLPAGYDSYWRLSRDLFPALPAAWGIPMVMEWDVDETHLQHSREFFDFALIYMNRDFEAGSWRDDAVRQIAGICNVGVIAIPTWKRAALASGASSQDEHPSVEFRPNRGAPRFFFATEVVTVSGVAEMFVRLTQRQWPSTVAFVLDESPPNAVGVVHAIHETPNHSSIVVDALGDALLVASVTRHKYWGAFVDGEPAMVRVVNHTFQGVVVPSGRHIVEFRYFNPLIFPAAAVSLTMLVGLMVASARRSQ